MNAPIAFDTETALIGPALLAPPLVCLSYADDEEEGLVHHTDARELVETLLESDRVLVGHNVAFDFGVAAAKWPDLLAAIFDKYRRGEVTDTLLRQKLLDIASRARGFKNYSLEYTARRLLGRTLEKDKWRLRYGELHDTPIERWPQGAIDYAVGDARTTLDVYDVQELQSARLEDQFRQARAAWWLHLMSAWGLRTDPVAVEALAVELQRRYEEIRDKLVDAELVRADGSRDTKAAAEYMIEVCEREGLEVARTPKLKPKLDADSCDLTGDEMLEAYAEFSGLQKKIGTDVALLRRGVTVPIQARFNSLLESGRTSSSPNVQNLPRKGGVRECFVPRTGKVFAAADYARFELHTVSQVILTLEIAPRSKLADALNAGFDPHLELARRIVGCTYEEAERRVVAGDDEIDLARQTGKVGNFGFPGGLGIKRFVHFARKNYGVIITEEKAAELKRYWLEAWPEFVEYLAWISQQCKSGPAEIKQVFVKRWRHGCSYCEAANTLFQGLAADAAKAAGFLIAHACYVDTASPLFGGRPVNFVHDEFIVEVDDNARASAAAEELARLMVLGASRYLPDVPAVAEPYLARRMSKKAKPIRNDKGELIPWDL